MLFIENGGVYYKTIGDMINSNYLISSNAYSNNNGNDIDKINQIKNDVTSIDSYLPVSKFSIGNTIKYKKDDTVKPNMIIALSVFMTVTAPQNKFGYLSGIIIPDRIDPQIIQNENVYSKVKNSLYDFSRRNTKYNLTESINKQNNQNIENKESTIYQYVSEFANFVNDGICKLASF